METTSIATLVLMIASYLAFISALFLMAGVTASTLLMFLVVSRMVFMAAVQR